jgi:predicted nucleic acid-binding protein
MAKNKLKDILLDADVISHFVTGGQILILHKIFPNKIYILDKVYDELIKFRSKKIEIENLLNFGIITKIDFPTSNPKILKEYLYIKKQMFKGDGESACLAYVRYTNDIIGSSNLKDIKHYCSLHAIELLTTMDFLAEALRKEILTEIDCNDFISKVLAAGSKLPVKKMADYKK